VLRFLQIFTKGTVDMHMCGSTDMEKIQTCLPDYEMSLRKATY